MQPGTDRNALWALAIVSLVVQLPFVRRGYSPLDEGSMLAIAQALGDGDVLYRDKATFISPFMYELMRFLLSTFGESLAVGRVFAVAVFSATVLAVYAIARSFVGVRWAAVTALSLCVLKPLAMPLWTIPNYNQLSMLFALSAAFATLRFLRGRHTGWLVVAGSAIGLTVVTKLSLGGAIGLAAAAAVGFDALRGPSPRELLRRAIVLGVTGSIPAALMIAWYASQGAFEIMLDRTLLSLVGVSSEMRVPMPDLAPWSQTGDGLFELQYEYFPPPVFSWALLRDIDLYGSGAGRLLEQVVKLFYYGPLAAIAFSFVVAAREGWRGAGDPACRWLLLAAFSALSYVSTAHRLDFAHILNIAPAPLVASAIVLAQPRLRALRIAPVVLVLWILVGAVAAYAVFDLNDTRLESPRGDLIVSAADAADARRLLAFLDGRPRDERILMLRTMPLFYFLADRPIPGRFDLFLPGYFRPGEDAQTAAEIESIDLVIYNPNDSIGIPKPITEFAPLTARALAERFAIEEVLSPTAFVLRPTEAPHGAVVSEIARDFRANRSTRDRVAVTSWFMYPVITTIVRDRDRAICFGYRHDVGERETLTVRPMFKHLAWTQRFWHDAARRAHLAIEARPVGKDAGPPAARLYAADLRAGPPAERIEIPLDRYAGQRVALRFCAQRFAADHRKHRVATVGWADPRIERAP